MNSRAVGAILFAAVIAGFLVAVVGRESGPEEQPKAPEVAEARSSSDARRLAPGRDASSTGSSRRTEAPANSGATAESSSGPGDRRGGYSPDPLTDVAMQKPTMADLAAADPAWSAETEAQQRFHAFEQDIIALRPLDPDGWKAVQKSHQKDALDLLRRAKDLTDQERPEDARALMDEWNRLTGFYKDEAYGRGGGPPKAE